MSWLRRSDGLVAHRSAGKLRDKGVGTEAVEAERLNQLRCPAGRDRLRERNSGDGRGLEAVRSPPAVDKEAVDLGDAHDRAGGRGSRA